MPRMNLHAKKTDKGQIALPSLSNLLPLLRCPDCGKAELLLVARPDASGHLQCAACGAEFPILAGRPVLIRHDNAVFPLAAYIAPASATPTSWRSRWLPRVVHFIPDPSINLARKRVLEKMQALLADKTSAVVLVVGSGKQRDDLNRLLNNGVGHGRLKIIYSDIDREAEVDLFCDGHNLPFIDQSIDAAITTVVLEHVASPERVVAEMHRVVKPGGLVYSEMPFMQQVHEGAYDFTRYSLSGHRRLFNGFAEIDSGMVAGPATTLVWAIENFSLAFVSRPILRLMTKALVRLVFSWLKYIDVLLRNRPEAMDGASCTYFLGARIEHKVSDAEIIARYVGAKHLRHV